MGRILGLRVGISGCLLLSFLLINRFIFFVDLKFSLNIFKISNLNHTCNLIVNFLSLTLQIG